MGIANPNFVTVKAQATGEGRGGGERGKEGEKKRGGGWTGVDMGGAWVSYGRLRADRAARSRKRGGMWGEEGGGGRGG